MIPLDVILERMLEENFSSGEKKQQTYSCCPGALISPNCPLTPAGGFRTQLSLSLSPWKLLLPQGVTSCTTPLWTPTSFPETRLQT